MSGFSTPCKQHVHAVDSQHGVVEVKSVKQITMEMLPQLGIGEHFRMPLAERFADGHQKTARSTSRIADNVRGLGLDHLHHQPNNVARRAKLSVLSGAGNLAQHVFVEVALGVPVFHGDFVDHVHDLGQQRRRGNGEAGALHVLGVGCAVATQGSQPGEDVLADHRVHLADRCS
jgi:hypothetical protein